MEKKYYKMCGELEALFREKGKEEDHKVLQDCIYRNFIKDCAENKLDYEKVTNISNMIKDKVIKYDRDNWVNYS